MYFAVRSEQGPAWDRSKPMREQPYWPDHVTFINGLIDDDFLLLGGPLADQTEGDSGFRPASDPVGDDQVYRTMVVVEASGSGEVARRLAEDPWIRFGVITMTSIDHWDVLAGDPSQKR